MVSLKSKSIKIISKFSTCNCICQDHSSLVAFVCVFEVFCVTHQCCDDRESRFEIMFREDSQIDSAKETTPHNVGSVLWRLFSTLEVVQYIGGITSVLWGDSFSTVGGSFSTVEVVQYSGG